jgi:transglutaminase-like putative cysteine protease
MGWSYSLTFRVVSIAVLFFFLWTFGGLVDIAYAAKNGSQLSVVGGQKKSKQDKTAEKLNRAIYSIEKIITDRSLDITSKKERLKTKKTEIELFDKEIRKRFAETKQKLRYAGMPERILKRHEYYAIKYDHEFDELRNRLDAIDRAVDECQINAEIEKTMIHLEKLKPPEKQKLLDPDTLPHRKAEPVKVKPRTKAEKFANNSKQYAVGSKQTEQILIASNGSFAGLLSSDSKNSDLPLPIWSDGITHNPELLTQDSFLLTQAGDLPKSDDLAETIEVQLTPSITTKATELGNDPVRIYNWVRNNIEFVPTYGSIQGADMCLQTMQCNAFDTSSLLIALLRASNIHARYVEGTVDVPIDKVMNWVGGFTDPMAAIDFMAAGGIPTGGITSGGEIIKARFEHVWVEAWVDYIPYRGAVHEQGDTWIPLDASYKQYNYVDGLDVDAAVLRDVDVLWAEVENQSIIDTGIPSITGVPSATIRIQLTDFLTQLNEHIATNLPEVDNYYELNKALHGDRALIEKNMRFLPNSLEADVIVKLNTYSVLPDTMRHKISFDLGSADLYYESSLAYTTSLPEISGKRITLSYTPATPDDSQVMSNADTILDFPVYLVKIIPELKIEGQTVARGESVVMGQRQSFETAFYHPHGMTERIDNTIQAGEYYAVGLDINNVSFQYLSDRVNNWQPDIAEERDDRLGELLHITAMFHYARLDHLMDELSRSSDIVSLRHPSESMVGMSFNADYLFNTPTTISSLHLNMDVDRDVIYPASRTNDSDAEVWFMVQKGLYSSSLEHFAFEELMGFGSVSTVRLLDLANQQKVPIYIVNNENSERVPELQISSAEKQNILNAINTGKTVLVPEKEIQHLDYSGIGYAIIDPRTGAGAYMISGGMNGGSTAIRDGETVRERVKDLVDLGKELLDTNSDWISLGYQTSIRYILKKYPYIADSPTAKFPEFDVWSKYVLNFKNISECDSCDKRIKTIMGQQILYYTVIMVMDITDPIY